MPSALDDAAAAGFWIPHMTGWAALVDRGRIAAGDWLAVLGAAGGSGIAAVQLGNALGARGDRRRRRRAQGGLLPRPRRRGGRRAPQRRAGGGPARRVGRASASTSSYDPVGGESAEEAHGALARGGRLLAVGFASGRWPDIDTQLLVMTEHVGGRRVRRRLLAG